MNLKYIFSLLFIVVCSSFINGQQTYFDNFNNTSYSNNNGTQNFSAIWDDSEDNNPGNGRISISGGRLVFENLDGQNIRRTLNLNGASSVTLTLDYYATSRGGESLRVQLYDTGSNSFQTIATINSDTNNSISYTLTANQISTSSEIRFEGTDNRWGNSDRIEIDNVQFTANFGPNISIGDVTVNEGAGTATFTATAGGTATAGSYAVNYETQDLTASSGSDYGATAGTMTFNGAIGDTETITVPILDDIDLENPETFRIVMISSSNSSVSISDTALGTITDNDSISITDGATTNECGKVFLDSGGLGNYGNNESIVHTLCPETGTDYVTVDFTSFDVEAGFDFLYIYDGSSTGSTLIGQYDNNNIPTTIAASAGGTGCLTFRFTSDGSVNGSGFQADIKCFQEGPRLVIDDISVDEDAGTAVFTVTSTRARHGTNVFLLGFVNTQFTVNYTTTNGTALSGSDYTTTSGTLTFNGAIGNQ